MSILLLYYNLSSVCADASPGGTPFAKALVISKVQGHNFLNLKRPRIHQSLQEYLGILVSTLREFFGATVTGQHTK